MHRTIWIVGSHHNWSELDCIWICASNGTCYRNCRICWNELTDCHRKETLFPNRKPSSDLVAVCMVTVIAKQRHERKTHSQTLTKQLNDVLAGTRFQSHSTVSCLSPICLPNKWRDIVDAFQMQANSFVSCVAMHCISIGHTIMTTHLMVIFLIGICFCVCCLDCERWVPSHAKSVCQWVYSYALDVSSRTRQSSEIDRFRVVTEIIRQLVMFSLNILLNRCHSTQLVGHFHHFRTVFGH